MNLHGIVSSVVGAVNPVVPIVIQVATGYTTNGDGTQVPSYAAPATYAAQVQSMTFGDLAQTSSLNIQGEKRSVYVNGRVNGIVRDENKGGDLVTFNGEAWLIVHVLEYWPDWCKFVITRQLGAQA